MANPYIVKESSPYTIAQFVTGRPLDDDVASTPDEHGVYPISPLGFLYEDVDSTLSPVPDAEYTSGASDTVREAVISALSGRTYHVADTPAYLYGTRPTYDIKSMAYADGKYIIEVVGNIRESSDEWSYGYIGNANTGVDYSSLGIVGVRFTIKWDADSSYADGVTTVTLAKPDDSWRLTGTIGSGRIVLGLDKNTWANVTDGSNRYVLPTDTGILYKMGAEAESPFTVRLDKKDTGGSSQAYNAADNISTLSDRCGNSHLRHVYSDREVMEWVERKAGGFISSGVHPSSIEGDLTNAGALPSWFVSSGKVDISGGMKRSVMVNGFGLGAGYFGDSDAENTTVSEKPRFNGTSLIDYGTPESEKGKTTGSIYDGFVDHPPVGHPVLKFGYANNSEAMSDNGIHAISCDWPFGTNYTNYTNNSITFVGHAVTVGGSSVGGLIDTTSSDACPDCGGVGITSEGTICPTCNGTGEINAVPVDIDRAHICLFNDFTAKSSAEPYGDGDTVLKKTFVHLATPLDTKDGATYEITVSLPMVNTASAFSGTDRIKDLSAYYAYVSQPRVYVMSGTWKFSSTRVVVDDPDEAPSPVSITGNGAFLDSDGNKLAKGLPVRFTLSSTKMTPKSTEFIGTLEENGDTFTLTASSGTFPYDPKGRGWVANDMYVCGLAYLDPDEDYNSSDTPLGLVSRNKNTLELADYGSGVAGSLNERNRFFTLDEKEGRDNLDPATGTARNKVDNRYVVATVYPTATNTFPWAIAGRRKIANFSRVLTDEIDVAGSVLDLAWKANRDLVALDNLNMPILSAVRGKIRSAIGWTDDTYLANWSANNNQLTYSISDDERGSGHLISRAIRVALPKYIGEDYPASKYHGNQYEVVKQTLAAIDALSEDFYGMRLKWSESDRSGNIYIPTNTSETAGFEWNTGMFNAADHTEESSSVAEIWHTRMRHVPRYVYDAADVKDADNPELYSYADLAPFIDHDSTRALYREANKAYVSVFGTTGDSDEVPCDLRSAPVVERSFHGRSVIQHILEVSSSFSARDYYYDILRESEFQTVSVDEDTLAHPYRFRYGDEGKSGLAEVYDAYTKILSVDGVPVPSDSIKLSDILPELSTAQLAYVGGDAFASYRAKVSDEFDFVSDRMPTSDTELAKFLRTYTPMYASGLPLRMWNSRRVYVPKGGIPDTEKSSHPVIYYTRIKWLESELADCEELKRDYANDMFARGSKAPYYADPNLAYSYTDRSQGDSSSYLETDYSVPPGTVSRALYTKYGFADAHNDGGKAYVRVFMKFAFSARAGRWYCMDYRQAPVAYLTPLYGAKSLDRKENSIYNSDGTPATLTFTENDDGTTTVQSSSMENLWKESMCGGCTWQDAATMPYYDYAPMNIAGGVVPFLFKKFPYKESKLDGVSYELVTDGEYRVDLDNDYPTKNYMSALDNPATGLGLFPPADCNGNYRESARTLNGAMANFWSVRKHIRPAVSVMPNTDIPGTYMDSDDKKVDTRTGGNMSDATLWGQFSYPPKGTVEYHLPDAEYPLADMTQAYLNYRDYTGVGKIQAGDENTNNDTVYAFKD